MKAVIHIGTEKTGSTSIQSTLHDNRQILEQHGVYYLRSPGIRNHRALPAYCMADSRFDDYCRARKIKNKAQKERFKYQTKADLIQEIEQLGEHVNTVIMSSEHFHSRLKTKGEINNLKELLSPYFSEIQVVVYLREQCEVAVSLYSTAVKTGTVLSFDSFIESKCRIDNLYFDYHKLITRWGDVFGKENLVIRLFEREEFINCNLIDDFCSIITPSLIGCLVTGNVVVNESLNSKGQRLGVLLNKHFPRVTSDGEENPFSRSLHLALIKHCSGKGQLATIEQTARIRKEFLPGNEILRDTYFPQREGLFNNRNICTTVESEQDSFEDVLDSLFSMLSRRIISRPNRYQSVLKVSANKLNSIDESNSKLLRDLAKELEPK